MKKEEDDFELPPLERASDVAKAHFTDDELLFDEFWRRGELAIMFGREGVGKSVLAVQIADAIAKGRPMHGFTMPTGVAARRKVLYIDLNSNDTQFSRRYSRAGLSANLMRVRIDDDLNIAEKIESLAAKNEIETIIVDSLDELRRTAYGAREMLDFVRKMRRLSRRSGISILVLASEISTKHTDPTPDLHGVTRSISSFADGVFLIRKWNGAANDRYIEQLRTSAAKLVWPIDRAPMFHIAENENAMPQAVFDERFSPVLDQEMKDNLMTIAMLRGRGVSFREISEQMGLGKSYVHKLYKCWRIHAERWIRAAEALEAEEKAAAAKAEIQVADEAESHTPNTTKSVTFRPEGKPFLAALRRASILDLAQKEDNNGNTIYVEEWSDATNKPMVWYRQYNGGRYRRFVRGIYGIKAGEYFRGPLLDKSVRLNV